MHGDQSGEVLCEYWGLNVKKLGLVQFTILL